jgi:hypothetical protein
MLNSRRATIQAVTVVAVVALLYSSMYLGQEIAHDAASAPWAALTAALPHIENSTGLQTPAATAQEATEDEGLFLDDNDWPVFNDRPFTTFHCLCGPPDLPEHKKSCTPLFRHAVTDAEPGKRLLYYLFTKSREAFVAMVDRFHDCAQFQDPHQRVFFWPRDGKFQVLFAKPTPRIAKTCPHRHKPAPAVTDELPRSIDLEWHVGRWFGLSLYHLLYDRGGFQMWLQRHLFREMAIQYRLLHPDGEVRLTVNNINDVEAMHTERYLKGHTLIHPVQELYNRFGRVDDYRWHQPGVRCAPWQGLGYLYISPMTYDVDWVSATNASAPWIARAVTDLHRSMAQAYPVEAALVARTDEAMIDLRGTSDFDNQQRARGIQPQTRELLAATIQHSTGMALEPFRLHEGMTLREQYAILQTHQIVVCGEGAVTGLQLLSRPNTTWIMVYNHSRPANDWRHSNFHAGVTQGIPWIRLIIFVIVNGTAGDVNVLRSMLQDPFVPGVHYIGADRFGQ